MCVYHVYAWCPRRSEKGCKTPSNWSLDGWSLYACWELSPGLLEEQPGPLSAEPSLCKRPLWVFLTCPQIRAHTVINSVFLEQSCAWTAFKSCHLRDLGPGNRCLKACLCSSFLGWQHHGRRSKNHLSCSWKGSSSFALWGSKTGCEVLQDKLGRPAAKGTWLMNWVFESTGFGTKTV